MRPLALAALLSLAAWAAAPALAHPGLPGGGPPPGFEPRPEEIIASHAQELGIDAATLEKIRALGEQHRAERDVIVAALQEQKLALRKLLEGEHPSESEAIALARKIGTLETDLSVARLGTVMRMHALLTPAQNAALHEKMRERFAQRRALLDAATAACQEDLAAQCAGEAGPPGPPLLCLLEKQRSGVRLAPACETALRELPPPRMFHFRGPGLPPGGGEPSDVLVPAPPDAGPGE